MVVLDTHALIWWTLSPEKLGARAARAIASADRIGIPAIAFWETSLLARKGRLQLDVSALEWASTVRAIPRVDVLDLTADIALAADGLEMHDDPADRFIAATAVASRAPLVTRDRNLRRLPFLRTIW